MVSRDEQIEIRIRSGAEPISGVIKSGSEESSFVGWLELMELVRVLTVAEAETTRGGGQGGPR